MGKRFKGKLCVYCQKRPSITQGDHVFPRELFLITERENPIKVPACNCCNNDKSKIEHYLATVLPFGGRHKDAKEHLSTLVPSRLENNIKLLRTLSEGKRYVWRKNEKGVHVKRMIIPFDENHYTDLFKYIVKALSWYEWKTYIKNNTLIYSTALTKSGDDAFNNYFFKLKTNIRAEKVIGGNTVKYTASQAIDNNQISFWLFKLYGGLTVSNKENYGDQMSSSVGVITGPPSQKNNIIGIFE